MAGEAGSSVVRRIISGGQTGVDRAALDAALELGIEHGGWCPLGRLAEDGFIPARYALRQTPSSQYAVRTERNVIDSDGTLILFRRELAGGTDLTRQFCLRHRKPLLLIDLAAEADVDAVRTWIASNRIATLNVAGPRESTSPGISAEAKGLLLGILSPQQSRPAAS